MKQFFTCLLICSLPLLGYSGPVFDALVELNHCWAFQKDPNRQELEAYPPPSTQKEWIRLHLSLVEKTLRARNTPDLTPAQKANRLRSLDALQAYIEAGNFPVNDRYSYRTPIFIDQYDNFCAVGYLVKASGHEDVSRMIAAHTNVAYVEQMHYRELDEWALNNGFSSAELAWIQPAYGPERYARRMGGGTNGEVMGLYANNSTGKLYVGGRFSTVDKTIPALNIAYVTETNDQFTWHSMGAGVDGPVHAITEFNGDLFIAGAFNNSGTTALTNVAKWDGSAWQPAGCTYGAINDLVVFNNELYAVGDFDVCAALADVNLAKWDGTYWIQYPGLTGRVNTVEIMDTVLLLGGSFDYLGNPTNIIKWNENMGFQSFNNTIANEVTDIQRFHDTVYAVCRHTSAADTNLLFRLNGDTWTKLDGYNFTSNGTLSINSLCAYNDTLQAGGNFSFYPGQFTPTSSAGNCASIYPYGQFMHATWMNVDSAINKMVLFKNKLVAGGSFKYGNDFEKTELNSITYQSSTPTAIHTPAVNTVSFEIYPNPAGSFKTLTVENNFDADSFLLRDLNGKIIFYQPLTTKKQSFRLPALSAGLYIGELTNKEGKKIDKKFTVD